MNRVWRRLAARNIDELAVGAIKVEFRVQADGRVTHVKTFSNSGNQALADVAIRTVQETTIPPIPGATLQQLPDGYMLGEVDFSVTPPSR